MKTTAKTSNQTQPQKNSGMTGKNKNATNPKKPNNNPDQTPDREVEGSPRAKTGKNSTTSKPKIGFKK